MPSVSPAAVIEHLAAVLHSDDVEGGLADILSQELVYNGERIWAHRVISSLASFRKAVPDLRCSLEVATFNASWTSSLWTLTGTHSVDYQHPVLGRAPATQRPIEFACSLHCRVEGGKIVEAWEVSDRLELLQQMHILPVLGLGTKTHASATSGNRATVHAAEAISTSVIADRQRTG